jgi:1,2-dihydroxy-3-keto-5-methylthiopentene dioxygenase
MSWLRIFSEHSHATATPLLETSDGDLIAQTLQTVGASFERWPTVDLPADVNESAILETYAKDIQRLQHHEGYQSVDVVVMTPEHPDRVALRQKFLSEHTHAEDEVRFFVEGSGLFSMHANGQVFVLLCERGDLIRVPARMRHWFDMGETPFFTAVRLFTNPDGWVAEFTGDAIAEGFPKYPDAMTLAALT